MQCDFKIDEFLRNIFILYIGIIPYDSVGVAYYHEHVI